MKQVDEIAQELLIDTNHFATACHEIHTLNETGLWPKHILAMGPFMNALTLEGYPRDGVMNIAINWVKHEALRQCSIH